MAAKAQKNEKAICRLYPEPVVILGEYLVDGQTVYLVKTGCGREFVRKSQLEFKGELNIPGELLLISNN